MPRRDSKLQATGSNSADSTDSNHSPGHEVPMKRKPTYLIRKEEEKSLQDEILQLQAQVAVLKTRGMPAGSSIAADPGLQHANAKSKALTNAIKQQQLGIASAQSLMMECMRTQYSNPLCTRICLKKDWGERRATLLAIRDQKPRNAYEYVMARNAQSPVGQDENSNELFGDDNGDVISLGSTVVNFPGVRSLRQVFEALWFYLTNMEISISERLGHITVREDYDMIEGSAYNARITSSNTNGLITELNTVVFGQLFEQGDPRFGDEPCAIVASDCVDEDELYPYHLSEHVRKDISGGIVLTATRRKKQPATGKFGQEEEEFNPTDLEEELVVTMRRTGYLKLHRPEFSVAPFALQELEAGIADWGQVMIKTMREVLYARA
ncbi:hypothetical protein PR003_g10082 [Phytophthora rubi]|uniref:Uncharacterized protein n=1 Tax=Phytophthora rubi TaxID=129364 RepID=A0A6A3NMA1_9STRA|nr:hypothetical protein PR001_g9693 [Phytophthora rubi]KAE9042314.1 hypothetical protein PR002_g3984 [Phytophthora rubi]KAE9341243.1 hypothetical protein PR003_g10082 [Phytophthora rubi]